jgi:hypothetical protein
VTRPHPLGQFDPGRLAYLEKENWVAYYQRRWPRLLVVSVGLVRQAFGLPLCQAIYGAYLVARAEVAAAPLPENDLPTAERYMRRFFRLVKRAHRLEFDLDQAARLEVNWWVVHRRLSGQVENRQLEQALVDYYSTVFGLSAEQAESVAYARAQAMLFSDEWVQAGRQDGSPLLEQEEAALLRAYRALKSALAPGSAPG